MVTLDLKEGGRLFAKILGAGKACDGGLSELLHSSSLFFDSLRWREASSAQTMHT